MTPEEALAKLSDQGDSNDFDDGYDNPEGCGWFGWKADPSSLILTVTWQSDQEGTEKQEFSWMLTPTLPHP